MLNLTVIAALALLRLPPPGVQKTVIDGVPFYPNVVFIDDRPLYTGDGEPLSIVIDVTEDDGDIFVLTFERPLFGGLRVDFSPWTGEQCVYEIRFEPIKPLGDVTRDGKVTTGDMAMIKFYACPRLDEFPERKRFDLDRDGDVDEDDMAVCKAEIGKE